MFTRGELVQIRAGAYMSQGSRTKIVFDPPKIATFRFNSAHKDHYVCTDLLNKDINYWAHIDDIDVILER